MGISQMPLSFRPPLTVVFQAISTSLDHSELIQLNKWHHATLGVVDHVALTDGALPPFAFLN
jgi:hypothetical protein